MNKLRTLQDILFINNELSRENRETQKRIAEKEKRKKKQVREERIPKCTDGNENGSRSVENANTTRMADTEENLHYKLQVIEQEICEINIYEN